MKEDFSKYYSYSDQDNDSDLKPIYFKGDKVFILGQEYTIAEALFVMHEIREAINEASLK